MRHTKSTEGRSVRLLRVGEQMRHALSDILMRCEVHDEVLASHSISVTEVRMSPDLRHATVFVKSLLGTDEPEVLDALKRNVRYLRGEVSRRVKTRYAPALKFLADESFEQGSHIDGILRAPHIARDLGQSGEEEA